MAKKARLVATPKILAELESWAPKGYKFARATFMAINDEGNSGVRVYFARKRPEGKRDRRKGIKQTHPDAIKALRDLVDKLGDKHESYVLRNPGDRSDAVIDVLLPDAEVRRLFNLGDDAQVVGCGTIRPDLVVEMDGKKSTHKDRTRSGRWRATGFYIACRR